MHGEVVAYSFSGYVYEVEEGPQSCERFSCSDRVVMSDCSIFTEGAFHQLPRDEDNWDQMVTYRGGAPA